MAVRQLPMVLYTLPVVLYTLPMECPLALVQVLALELLLQQLLTMLPCVLGLAPPQEHPTHRPMLCQVRVQEQPQATGMKWEQGQRRPKQGAVVWP